MQWRMMTTLELKREFPRASNILAGVAEIGPTGEIYSDTVFLLHGDRTITLPHTELDFNELIVICDTLQQAATEHFAALAAGSREQASQSSRA